MAKRKFLIDTDAGIDDAQAILMALSSDDVTVVALTTGHGNVDCAQVGRNVLRLLKVAGRLEIPVYKGSDEPLSPEHRADATNYHGLDGFGDVPDPEAPGDDFLQSESAVDTIVRLAQEHEGELELICLAPLTNIAHALKRDPKLGSKLKRCYIMGGNYRGEGNITPHAEFNFYADPEAANYIVQNINCDLTIVCWELCLDNALSWKEHAELRSHRSHLNDFLSHIEASPLAAPFAKQWPTYVLCDEVIMAVSLSKDVIKASRQAKCKIETKIDHDKLGCMSTLWTEDGNVCIVTELNMHLLKGLLTCAVSAQS